jgi:hypothetical protein
MFKRVALGLGALALAVSVLLPATHAVAQTPPTPQCPAGTAFNPATGACETPLCAAGATFDPAGFCTTPIPGGGLCVPPAVPFVGAGGVLVCGTAAPAACPVGLAGPSPTGICSTAAALVCPPGQTLAGGLCEPSGCAPGQVSFAGLCFTPGNTGPASAQGGNGGDAAGGDGGRGGAGVAPQCNQNISDTFWGDEPVEDCAAGGIGGDAGDGGISEGGDGGLAFTDGFA